MHDIEDLTGRLWRLAGPVATSDLGPLEVSGDRHVLPSVFDVTGLAAASIGAATAAVAGLVAARTGAPTPVAEIDTRAACAAFVGELLFTPRGWERPGAWDPVAGDYRSADGWIRLHTNYATHRRAALDALHLADDETIDREAVAAVVAGRMGSELEQEVVDCGGAAAVMHDAGTWRGHPHGSATVEEKAVSVTTNVASPAPAWAGTEPARPLSGIRVLDLTRVIAGPVCTRYLAAHGADVMRIDPPGFAEVGALLPVATAGKRCVALDLRRDDDRRRFVELLGGADVVVHGLRPGAMEGLGLGPDELRSMNPGVIAARHDAYGWVGPWSGRRGFDSLVQMSCGIAAAGGAAEGVSRATVRGSESSSERGNRQRRANERGSAVDRPVSLPAQALDHATGYLMATAVLRALTDRLDSGRAADVTASLLGTANLLTSMPVPGGLDAPAPVWGAGDLESVPTAWGPADAVPSAGVVVGWPASYERAAGPLGRDDASW